MSESDKRGQPLGEADEHAQDEDFLQRWSQRKAEARASSLAQARESDATAESARLEQPDEQPGDEDMPPLDSLGQDSDYSGFLSPRVSEELRRLALRKMFHSAKFNVTDGLDDYALDYSKMEPLGDIVTADMRFHMERAKERLAEAEKHLQQLTGEQAEQPGIDGTDAADTQVEESGSLEVTTSASSARLPEDQEKNDEPGDR